MSVLVAMAVIAFSADLNDFVECGHVDSSCKCDAEATVCIFQLYVEYVFTFTMYYFTLRHRMSCWTLMAKVFSYSKSG